MFLDCVAYFREAKPTFLQCIAATTCRQGGRRLPGNGPGLPFPQKTFGGRAIVARQRHALVNPLERREHVLGIIVGEAVEEEVGGVELGGEAGAVGRVSAVGAAGVFTLDAAGGEVAGGPGIGSPWHFAPEGPEGCSHGWSIVAALSPLPMRNPWKKNGNLT